MSENARRVSHSLTGEEYADGARNRCGGAVRVIASIEDQDIIDQILAHLRRKEQDTPIRPLLIPPTRAPPATLPLSSGRRAR